MTAGSPLSLPGVWDDVAAGYAEDLLPTFELYAADALEMARLPARAHIVDVAAGPGTLSLLAADRAERVEALDFSPEMVAVLRRRVAERGATNVRVQEGDGQALPFADSSFDGAFSLFGLMFFPDRAAGFRELRRVLKPGGRAVVSAWGPTTEVPVLAALFDAIRELLPDLPLGGGRQPLSDPEEFRAEMVAAGFREVEIRSVTHRVTTRSVDDFWRAQLRSSAPVALLRKGLPAEEWKAFAAAVVPRLERALGTGTLEVAWPAKLGLGVG